ncbi:MAG: hypothetical protein ABIP34_17090 [Rhodoferax sp.]|uniref:hypothetical protein n=1 Tax=Rhodoferax sp. TaxID=50421 RepID=UPI0032678DC0
MKVSHDMGDILGVVDGRGSLVDECLQSPPSLQTYLAAQFTLLMANRRFRDALPGHLPGDAVAQSRLSDLEATLQKLANLSAV